MGVMANFRNDFQSIAIIIQTVGNRNVYWEIVRWNHCLKADKGFLRIPKNHRRFSSDLLSVSGILGNSSESSTGIFGDSCGILGKFLGTLNMRLYLIVIDSMECCRNFQGCRFLAIAGNLFSTSQNSSSINSRDAFVTNRVTRSSGRR